MLLVALGVGFQALQDVAKGLLARGQFGEGPSTMAWGALSLHLGWWMAAVVLADTTDRRGSMWVLVSTLLLAVCWGLHPVLDPELLLVSQFLHLPFALYGSRGGIRALSFRSSRLVP